MSKNFLEQLDGLTIPNHVAVIMDGNFRWAKKNNLPVHFGHKSGVDAVQKLLDAALEFKVQYLTIYAFSTENWQRPKEEVDYLMSLLKEYLNKEIDHLIKKDVKILVSGSLNNVDDEIVNKIRENEKKTKDNKSICLNIAFDYGARQDILSAFKKIMVDIGNDKINIDDVDELTIRRNLYNPEVPDPDLLIRTAGDMRLSNFLLWQLAYSELYFSKKFWPDFQKEDLFQAILDFNQRQRNYGRRSSKS